MQINADVTQARETHVTGYAEHRGSLNDKKKYRRAINIDLKLPEASTALAGVPRRKDFPAGEEGRQAWKAQFNAFSGDFAYSHVGAETVKRRMGSVGMWGDYCEREGHGATASLSTGSGRVRARSKRWWCLFAMRRQGRSRCPIRSASPSTSW